MAPVWKKTRLLSPADLPASSAEFRVLGVFNPAAVAWDGGAVLLVRVAEHPLETRPDQTPLPRYDDDGQQVVDWLANDNLELIDQRVVRCGISHVVRLTSASHLRVVFVGSDQKIKRFGPLVTPRGQQEEYGMEDPRITRIGDRYYVTYVAVSRHGVATALMSTTDFQSFERHGIIFPTENKDVVLLPERVGGDYIALHRPVGGMAFTGPEMWIARSPDLVHWGQHQPLYRGQSVWETGRVGAGAPPIRTERGWLEIYHGNRRPTSPVEVGAYCAGGMLLDLEQPARIRKLAPTPLLEPTEPYELAGFVPNVVFPGGIVEAEGRILLYYGAADESTAVAETTWDNLWQAFD